MVIINRGAIADGTVAEVTRLAAAPRRGRSALLNCATAPFKSCLESLSFSDPAAQRRPDCGRDRECRCQ